MAEYRQGSHGLCVQICPHTFTRPHYRRQAGAQGQEGCAEEKG